MKRTVLMISIVVLAACAFAPAAEKAIRAAPASRHIDLAICLDTSNSMDGLIESAKQKLWAVVNELAAIRPRPVFRVALYQYGNESLSSDTGWVQRVCELTDDLDTVYGKLFALRTNGGTEYVARVVRAATNELTWSADKSALRIIFVAGNEPATQDNKYKLQDVCAASAGKGIIINTIFCGPTDKGTRTGWSDAAKWADGRYAAIDQDSGTVVINTPYDKKLAELGAGLNKTYIAYGGAGRSGAANQVAQDANAGTLGAPAAAERAAAKAGGLYRNAGWDLVDAVADKKVDLAEAKEEDLPEEMRKMSPAKRKAYVEQQAKRRAEVQKQITDLSAKRDAHIKDEMAKKGLSEGKAFDAALRSAVRDQAEQRNFKFKE